MKRPSREERRAHAKREIASGDPRKSHADCPIEAAIEARRPPEARLSPFPQDDLVETPAPRPSLVPFGSSTLQLSDSPTLRFSNPPTDYVELHAQSAFSFLRASSLPEDLAHAAAAAGHAVFGLADAGGFYGTPRFHTAARREGVRPLVGAELAVDGGGSVALLCEDRRGYQNLCRLLTLGHARSGKEECRVTPAELADFRGGLVALSGGAPKELALLADHLGAERLFAEVHRHLDPEEERENRRRIDAARARGLRLVAGSGVRHATAQGKPLFDALTCIRLKTTLDAAGRRLSRNAERHVRPPHEMAALFRDLPDAVRATREIAERCAYTLDDLGYELPEPQFLHDSSLDGELWHRAMDGARARYGGPSSPRWPRAIAQIERELSLIAKLGLAGYFLIVHDMVLFCGQENVLVQGRGSAANSAVCYALGITAVDPVGMNLLFERFLSEERTDATGHKAWPDIDLDLPSGDQREKVIQHVYQRYGTCGAAMTANVITYRARSASREIGKVLGLPQEELDRLAKLLPQFEFVTDFDSLQNRAKEAGLATGDRRVSLYLQLCQQIAGLPRHLGQHSGGMIIARGRLDEIVPLEPASMPGRMVVQWDKDDCADLGIIKIDLLGLGMMAVLEQALPLVRAHEGVELDLAQLPENDPGVYRLLQTADTVGVFQVESRAQMATLPRMKPDHFYDIVVEVAIIRPGPIVGQMVNPYLERRAGRQEVAYPHPSLKPVLERTLGVPLFQEQLMRIAMVAANFTGGEADELRRAMGSKRSVERMKRIEERLRAGMTANGILPRAQDEIVQGITSFALYGFPESHAASFALIVYASAYLKVHHPHAFYAAMLNCWPMGFYSPATLVKDAQRRGVRIKAIDVARSDWLCTLEREGPEEELRLRLGLRYARGLREGVGKRIVEERGRGPFASIADLAARAGLRRDELSALAEMGALASVPVRPGGELPTRRAALWQAEAAARRAGLFARVEPREDDIDDQGHVAVAVNDHVDVGVLAHVNAHPRVHAIRSLRAFGEEARASSVPAPAEVPADRARSPLPEMGLRDRIAADLRGTGMTVGPHPVALERDKLRAMGVHAAAELPQLRGGRIVRAGGLCIVRQRPGTAKGFVFLSLEDETGISNIVIDPPTFEANRLPILASSLLVVEGRLEKSDGVTSVKGHRFWGLREALAEHVQSRDFH
ncbi:MAG TPA: error-prone DNA polymerase [Myxococcales bacterium]|jgi:error-prone DNA polymerase|nr:error-prone DNA polymerase [Myxococcales bacterium]